MLTQTVSCYHCGRLDLLRYGKAQTGKQKYCCETCGQCSRQNPGSNAHDNQFQAQVLAAYHERCSERGVCRIFASFCFGISRQTLRNWRKKSRCLAAVGNNAGSCAA